MLVIEIAHWYYIDYFQKEYPDLKAMTFPNFARKLFSEYPPLIPFVPRFQKMLDDMKSYKRNIPVYGGVILNHQMNRVLLVRGTKNSDGFSFPRGKVNAGESPLACAAREIYEEAGLSVEHLLDANEFVSQDARKANLGQYVTLYFVVVEEAAMVTKPQVLNEIGAIQWHSISRLIKEGNRSYLLPHFLPLIEQWAKRKNGKYVPAATHGRVVYDMRNPNAAFEDPTPEDPSTITSFYFDRTKLNACFHTPETTSASSTPFSALPSSSAAPSLSIL